MKAANAITQDVSIVKHDRINYTDEYKRKMARKYGLTVKDMQQIADEESLNATPEKAPDYFDYMEEVMEEKETDKQAKEMKEEPADEYAIRKSSSQQDTSLPS